MDCLRISLFVIILICVIPRRSDGSFVENSRNLANSDHSDLKATDRMSPSPSPVLAANLPQRETCDEVSNKCDIKDFNVTACLPFVGNGSQASYVLVINGGESSLKLNIVVHPVNIILEDIVISGQQVKKINLPPNTRGNSSITLHIENRGCTIQMGALLPKGFYTSYMTPINGTYVFIVGAIFMGGTWACCNLVKRKRRHLDGGVAYRELEMEAHHNHQDSDPTFVIETSDGWDQNWDDDDYDDDWDEEKAVAFSPGGNIARKVSKQSDSLEYVDTAQWGDDWDD